MIVPILLGGLVGLAIGFMVGFAPFGPWGGVIGAVVGLLAGSFILATLRRVARADAPEPTGGAREVAGTAFGREDAAGDGDDPSPDASPRGG